MQAEKERTLDIAFVLDEESLRRLDKIMVESNLGTNYVLGCTDGSSLKPSSIDELLSFPNTDARCIHTVVVDSGYNKKPFLRVKMTNSNAYGRSLEYRADGDEKDVFYLSDKMDQWITSIQQGYSSLAFKGTKIEEIVSFLMVPGGVLLTGTIPSLLKGDSPKHHPLLFLLSFIGLFLLLASFSLTRIRKWAYPVGIIAIGGGVHRLERYRSRQRTVSLTAFLSLLAAVVLGVISSLIASWLSH